MNVHSACTFNSVFYYILGWGYSLNSRSKKTVRVCKPPWIYKNKKKEYLFSSLWKHPWLAISSCYSPGKLLLVVCCHFYWGWFMRSSFLQSGNKETVLFCLKKERCYNWGDILFHEDNTTVKWASFSSFSTYRFPKRHAAEVLDQGTGQEREREKATHLDFNACSWN